MTCNQSRQACGNEPNYRDKEWLQEQYVEQRRTQSDIADECNVSKTTIHKWVKKHGFETRSQAEWRENNTEKFAPDSRLTDSAWLEKMYNEKQMSCRKIADECDCSESAVESWLRRHNININSRKFHISDRRLADAEWLREQYVNRKRDLSDIAEECDCACSTISEWLGRHNINARTRGGWEKGRREQAVSDTRLTDPDWLCEMYNEREKTCRQIADLCDCSESAVQYWLRNHGIETQPNKFQIKDERLADPEWLSEQYSEKGKSGYEIADICSVSFGTVYRWLRKHGIEITHDRCGENNPRWKGGSFPYGKGWTERKRKKVRERDGYACRDPNCSVTQKEHLEKYGKSLHVHHLKKAREVDEASKRNCEENLITLCLDCHTRWEKMADCGLVPQVVSVND
jgi:transposase